MKTTKRFFEQAIFACRCLKIGDYYTTIAHAYKNGGSAKKRAEFYKLCFIFSELENQRNIKVYQMGIISINRYMFTFACNFIDVETGDRLCYYATPRNKIIVGCDENWEDFKKCQNKERKML